MVVNWWILAFLPSVGIRLLMLFTTWRDKIEYSFICYEQCDA